MVSLDSVTLSFGNFDLFKGVSFLINPKDRIGLVGRNGAGKSTLLKLIVGEMKPTEGLISKPSDLTIGYLPQQLACPDKTTVWEETITAFAEVNRINKRITEINAQLYNDEDHSTLLNLAGELSDLNERLDYLEGNNIEEKTERVLIGLGFLRTDFQRPTKEFSGGWRMRIELAKILLKNPTLFLLDEPTNHLDIEAIQWLEDFLKEYRGAVLLISHDRAFLDHVTTRTVEVSLGKIYDYKVPYSKYVALRDERRQQQMSAFKNQQKMIEDTEKFVERFRYKATKAVQVQSRMKQLDKIERIEIDPEDSSSMHLAFPPSPRSGSVVFELKDVTKRYGNHIVLENIDFIIERGNKIALVGRNGEGKTTLAKMLLNEVESEGELTCGYQVKTGYYAQNQDEILDKEKTVLQTIDDIAKGEVRLKIRKILGAFLFSGEDVDKKVSVLSGGECSRLSLAKLLLEPVNFLILDEPTNHLDIRSKEILKDALQKYDGTLLLISHDRDFLDGLVNRIVEVRDRKLKEYSGNIWHFLEKKKIENFVELERKQTLQKQNKPKENKIDNKKRFQEKKEFDKLVRKVENKIQQCEKQISELEIEMQKMDEILVDPEEFKKVASDPKVFEKYNAIKLDLDKKMEEWEKLQTELSDLNKA
jgi:ATP-binding cassette, subfamily F, member 3